MTVAAYIGIAIAIYAIAHLANVCRELMIQQKHTDPVTGLPNRLGFEAMVAENLKDQTPLSIVRVGLDGFRSFTETHGSAEGDALLSETGERIRECTRPGDAVGYYGGDQFLVLLRGQDATSEVTSRILDTVDATAGISLYPDHGTDPSDLVRLSESVMQKAKTTARGRALVYEPTLR
jgi:GGDEF domain-containing protein